MGKMVGFRIINLLMIIFILSTAGVSSTSGNVEFQTYWPSRNYQTNQNLVNLTMFHINDLHGWLNPHDGFGGMATMMGYFYEEGYDPTDDSFLLLSGGDQNTGPALATISKGEAVIDVMNTMNFTAAAIGNHEFDYGIKPMNTRQNLAQFPILSANIFDVGTKNLVNFTIPWVIQEHGGLQVGIIGLTTISSYTSTHPKFTQNIDFGDYEAALRDNYDDVLNAGADLIIVLSHVVPNELINLASQVTDLNIPLFLGGHGGTPGVYPAANNSLVVMAGHWMTQFAKIELSFDTSTGEVSSLNADLIDNIEGSVTPVQNVQDTVDYWDDLIGLNEVITYTSQDIRDNPGSGIGNLATDAFLEYFYDLSKSYNFAFVWGGGGFRDYFRSGDITIADVVSVFPFENNLMEFPISGKELLVFYEETVSSTFFSGIRFNTNSESYEIVVKDHWEEISDSDIYVGLIPDYMWYVAYKDRFDVIDTGVHQRDTILSYFDQIDDLTDYVDYRFPDNLVPFSETVTSDTQKTSSSNQINFNFWTVGSIFILAVRRRLIAKLKCKSN
ncbi:MAG: bifunctional metallophosphatase/5'-nucleotidase [Candidatus Heimdallarchaeota archaeon]|nr:bifunctional metallophosphatase/5'-nucleotidase [Candidatus Heimdallarchaeota archaeon]